MNNYLISKGEFSDYEETTLIHKTSYNEIELKNIIKDAIENTRLSGLYYICLGNLCDILCQLYGFEYIEYKCDVHFRDNIKQELFPDRFSDE